MPRKESWQCSPTYPENQNRSQNDLHHSPQHLTQVAHETANEAEVARYLPSSGQLHSQLNEQRQSSPYDWGASGDCYREWAPSDDVHGETSLPTTASDLATDQARAHHSRYGSYSSADMLPASSYGSGTSPESSLRTWYGSQCAPANLEIQSLASRPYTSDSQDAHGHLIPDFDKLSQDLPGLDKSQLQYSDLRYGPIFASPVVNNYSALYTEDPLLKEPGKEGMGTAPPLNAPMAKAKYREGEEVTVIDEEDADGNAVKGRYRVCCKREVESNKNKKKKTNPEPNKGQGNQDGKAKNKNVGGKQKENSKEGQKRGAGKNDAKAKKHIVIGYGLKDANGARLGGENRWFQDYEIKRWQKS